MLRPFSILIWLCCAAVSVTASASSKLELTWQDLVPDLASFEDPFKALSNDELFDLATVARLRERLAMGETVSDASAEEAAQAEDTLEARGIDVEALLESRQEIAEKRRAAAEATVSTLHGEQIRMPGYLLPLEFGDAKVTEFLLVPYVGACIHAPPPPPNQIVHVHYPSGYEQSSLFLPVWVEGVMSVANSSHDLHLVDGSADVAVGYTVTANLVDSYQ